MDPEQSRSKRISMKFEEDNRDAEGFSTVPGNAARRNNPRQFSIGSPMAGLHGSDYIDASERRIKVERKVWLCLQNI